MLFIKKYLLLLFLIENIMAQTFLMGALSEILFYPFMAIGLGLFLLPSMWGKRQIEKFRPLYLLMALYVLYEFVIGIDYLSTKTVLYLLAKLSTFGIIISAIDSNEAFYKNKAVLILSLFMAFMLCYGLLTGGGVRAYSGRALAGFTNENTAGSMGALTVGFVLFYMKSRKWNIISVILVLLGFYGVLAGASRAGFLMLGLLVMFRYGISFKTISLAVILIIIGLFILPEIGVHTVGLQRMLDTYNGVEGTNRDLEREAAEWMIEQKPWIGWGYNFINEGYARQLTRLSPHNGYLQITEQMGYPCSIVFFLIIIVPMLKCIKYVYGKPRQEASLFFAIYFCLLINANFESLFVGAHEYVTNLFFVSLAMISSNIYSNKYNLQACRYD